MRAPWFFALAVCVAVAGAVTLRAASQRIGPRGNWGLDRIDQAVRGARLDGWYRYVATGAGVNIYIVDSGVQASLSEFAGRIHYVGDFHLSGDFRSPNTSDRPGVDCARGDGHGTRNASIAAGTTYGVAKRAAIWVLRAANCVTGDGDPAALERAIEWLDANAVPGSVVNVSYRPTVSCDPTTPTLAVNERIVRSIASKQLTYTLSAGGCTFRSWSDDVYDRALVAAATDMADAAFQPGTPAPTIYAPGAAITASASRPPYYSTDSGDSYAAPHVAGVAALYLQLHRGATPAAVRAALLSAALPVGLSAPLLTSRFPASPKR